MKAIYKTFAVLSIALFVFAIAKVGYDLYHFEDKIANDLGIVELSEKNKITPDLLQLGIFVGVAFAMALLSIMFLILSYQRFSVNEKPTIQMGESSYHSGQQQEQSFKTIEDIDAFSNLMSVHSHEPEKALEKALQKICNDLRAAQGILYIANKKHGFNFITFFKGYAYYTPESKVLEYEFGEGLAGQTAKDGRAVLLNRIPEGYMTVVSGLGSASPRSLLIVPIKNSSGETLGVIEIASFEQFNEAHQSYAQKVATLLGEPVQAVQYNISVQNIS
jgi:hypothetical protein